MVQSDHAAPRSVLPRPALEYKSMKGWMRFVAMMGIVVASIIGAYFLVAIFFGAPTIN